ncbi:hypothetical protein ACFL6Y_11875 [Elusimicrobiota bacterium]
MKKKAAYFHVKPIGYIKGDTLVVYKKWAQSLDGIDKYSHVFILCWLDRAIRGLKKIHPKGRMDLPE